LRAQREAGVEIRTNVAVAKIKVSENRARGVVLDNGDEFDADLVASSLDPRLTFTRLLDDQPAGRVRRGREALQVPWFVRQGQLRADGLPNFSCRPGEGHHLRGAISISPGIDYMERATTTRTDGSRGSRTSTSSFRR
jgi:phytoene dehydrogenase-like protein